MYHVFQIPKRDGSSRNIEAPDDALKARQQASLIGLRKILKVSPFAHAFQPYKNIVTMAMGHVGKRWVGCMDIKDFFPSIDIIDFRNTVENVQRCDPRGIDIHFHDFEDGKGMRLPQGAPASPFLSNTYLFKFDWRMAWLAYRFGVTYSRYADDLVFSGDKAWHIKKLFDIARGLLNEYRFEVNDNKTKLMHTHQRQMVCGIVVNEKINLLRKTRKNFRAELFQQKQKGGDLRCETQGRQSFHKMVLENKKESFTSTEIMNSIVLTKKLDKKGNKT